MDHPPPHAVATDALVASLHTNLARGLTAAQVEELLQRHGFNELAQEPPTPWWRRFLGQFRELVVLILVAAAILSGVLGDWIDTVAILAIVVLNALLGFLQEERAEQALAALQQLAAPLAKVLRDGVLRSLPARELLPGDIIELEAGDNVPADARLLQAFGLRVQEAALTGESVPVDKDATTVLPAATPLGDRRNMLYLGTVTTAGKATAVVVGTGMDTELGQIAGMLHRAEPEPTPLQRRLAELGKVLIITCLSIVAVIFVLQMLRGGQLVEVLLLSVSLAVAAVPEGLPAVVTIALALGLQRMVKRNALIRKLPSVETLGSVTVICSDKTGTLTRNEMTVREIVAGGHVYEVTGVGYTPEGQFRRAPHGSSTQEVVNPQQEPDLLHALTIAAHCNHARLNQPRSDGAPWEVIGDPTEGALLVAARKAGIAIGQQAQAIRAEIPFDSERKAMSVILDGPSGTAVIYTKGAPEVILNKCVVERRDGRTMPLTDERRQEIMDRNTALASHALRVLALASRDVELPQGERADYPETDLTFAGLVGMIDPPREEAREAVRKCHGAGIRPVMITGDHPATALAIARELEMAKPHDHAVSGQELDTLNDDALTDQVEKTAVYARVSAEHKLRVVKAWKRRHHIVAMTGDGINDAPALKAADIGIAMGITGTDVTKEASDMVLTDDNFASIVNAVEEGRGIFDNIQKFLHYLLASNASEVLLMFFAALVGWPAPLRAIQILWINLVTDSLPALALAMEKPEPDIMRRPPRPPQEAVLTRKRALLILLHGSLMALVAILGFAIIYLGDPNDTANLSHAQTVAFCVLAFSQLFFSLGCRSQRYTMPELGFFSNPYLFLAIAGSTVLQFAVVSLAFVQALFETAIPSWWEWGLILGLALTPVTIIEVAKLVRAAWQVRKTPQANGN